jgi:hypothetical protein
MLAIGGKSIPGREMRLLIPIGKERESGKYPDGVNKLPYLPADDPSVAIVLTTL